jgi:DNA invertase Pin-like site-specific DNA recombinase
MTKRLTRCAIYTRKSTEEGLDQTFNSLDAQREACEAYVLSQAGEGWSALSAQYDDGGFSGGTMERPALVRLLADIDAGRIDIVVVYKIDRLTRSLADFARIVERLEKHNVSFVSVTQAFNTTSSMGRLTLNVLLSFAQFEREVTAERIRDKFAASRKRGMFMGGTPPLGYDAKDRQLVINPEEAETVRFIFARHLELGSVALVRNALDAEGIRTKVRNTTHGKVMGGGSWYIGPLRHILRNRVYVGDVVHKGTVYPGLQQPIIAYDLFDAVQAKLNANRASHHRGRTIGRVGLLTGLLFDDQGYAMSPKLSRKPGKNTYLYYASQGQLQKRDPKAGRPVPGRTIEALVREKVAMIAGSRTAEERSENCDTRELIRRLIARIDVRADNVTIRFSVPALTAHLCLDTKQLSDDLCARLMPGEILQTEGEHLVLTIPARLRLRGGVKRIEDWNPPNWTTPAARHDHALIKALALADNWRSAIERNVVSSMEELATQSGHDRSFIRKVIRLAFLAPDIQRAILTGRQSRTLTLAALMDINLPALWTEQRTLLRVPV